MNLSGLGETKRKSLIGIASSGLGRDREGEREGKCLFQE